MNINNQNASTSSVRDGAGRLITERRLRPRPTPRTHGPAVLTKIKLALLDQQLLSNSGGFDPYDHRQGRKGADVWGSKRRD